METYASIHVQDCFLSSGDKVDVLSPSGWKQRRERCIVYAWHGKQWVGNELLLPFLSSPLGDTDRIVRLLVICHAFVRHTACHRVTFSLSNLGTVRCSNINCVVSLAVAGPKFSRRPIRAMKWISMQITCGWIIFTGICRLLRRKQKFCIKQFSAEICPLCWCCNFGSLLWWSVGFKDLDGWLVIAGWIDGLRIKTMG